MGFKLNNDCIVIIFLSYSRAILGYLAHQYGSDTDLYPSDPAAKAAVDNLLYFDIGTLNNRFNTYVVSLLF